MHCVPYPSCTIPVKRGHNNGGFISAVACIAMCLIGTLFFTSWHDTECWLLIKHVATVAVSDASVLLLLTCWYHHLVGQFAKMANAPFLCVKDKV